MQKHIYLRLRLHVYNFRCENVRPLTLATRRRRALPHGKSRPGEAEICSPPDGGLRGEDPVDY